jgi:anti-sigma factor RsiW
MTDSHAEHLLRRDGRLSELTLDRYRLGELSDEESARVEARLLEAPDERAVLEAMRSFESSHGLVAPRDLVERAAASSGAKVLPFRRRLAVFVPVTVAVAAAAAAVTLFAPSATMEPPAEVLTADTFRIKGARFEVEVHAHDGARSRRLSSGAPVRPGERLGFRVEGGEGGHLLIAGIDAQHDPYLCYPQDTGGASAPAPGKAEAVALPAAVRIDDSPGAETLVAVLCPTPFSYDDLAETMRAAHAKGGELPTLRDGCLQRVIPLTKELR